MVAIEILKLQYTLTPKNKPQNRVPGEIMVAIEILKLQCTLSPKHTSMGY